MRAVALALLSSAARGDIVFSRTIDKAPGAGSVVIEGSACTGKDAYGSNNCDLHWGTNYTLDLDLQLNTDLDAGSKVTVDAKLDGFIPFKVTCPVCGGTCSFKIPIVGKSVSIPLPACPIKATGLKQKVVLPLPSSSPVPLKVGATATVSVTDATGAEIAHGEVTANLSPSARAAVLREQAKAVGVDLGQACSSNSCSGVDCGLAITSCAAACALSFPAGCVSCIGSYPSCCRCASEHFGFDCNYC